MASRGILRAAQGRAGETVRAEGARKTTVCEFVLPKVERCGAISSGKHRGVHHHPPPASVHWFSDCRHDTAPGGTRSSAQSPPASHTNYFPTPPLPAQPYPRSSTSRSHASRSSGDAKPPPPPPPPRNRPRRRHRPSARSCIQPFSRSTRRRTSHWVGTPSTSGGSASRWRRLALGKGSR